ncbi:MAG: hypothetical protein AB1700_11915, partial [Bacillota bacterium]
RNDADPFAPDVASTQRYPAQPEAGYAGPELQRSDEVRNILAALASTPQPPDLPASVREAPASVQVELPPAEPLPKEATPAPTDEPPPPDRTGVPVVTIARLAPRDKQEGVAPGAEANGVVRAGEVKGEVRVGDISGVQESGAAPGGSSDHQGSGGAPGQGRAADEESKETSGSEGSPPPPQHKSLDEKDGIDEKGKKTLEAAGPGEAGKPSGQNAGVQVVGKPTQQATGTGASGGAPEQPATPGTTGKPPQQPTGSEVAGKPASAAPPQKPPADEKAAKAPPVEMPKPEGQKPPVTPPLLLLTGVISSGDLAYAIVRTPAGSSIVRQGDEIDGMMVKSIQGKTIAVIKQGEEFVIELGGGGKR